MRFPVIDAERAGLAMPIFRPVQTAKIVDNLLGLPGYRVYWWHSGGEGANIYDAAL